MEREYKPFSEKDAESMKRAGETFESRGFIKTEGFEKAVVFAMSLAEEIYNISSKHKRFRMELFYDAESLNVNYCFFCPSSDEQDAGTQEGQENPYFGIPQEKTGRTENQIPSEDR